MDFEFKLFSLLDSEQQKQIAQAVSEYTKGMYEDENDPAEMLEANTEQVMAKAVGFVALSGDQFVGYVAGNTIVVHNNTPVSEVGTLVVSKEWRGRGVATGLVGAMTMMMVDLGVGPYAFCNKKSAPIFKQAGYQPLCAWQVPASALEWCETDCKKKPFITTVCCDQILGYGGTTAC